MNRLFLIIGLISWCGLAGAQAPKAAVDDAVAQTVIAQSKTVVQAMKSRDADQLKSIVADDFHSIGSEGRSHDKAELMGSAKDGEVKDYLFYDPAVTRIDDGSVLVSYNLAVTREEGDEVLAPRYQKVSDLWVQRGNEWLLKFEQATPMRAVD
jgi:hypothetical protein